jgi:hypothetical protein
VHFAVQSDEVSYLTQWLDKHKVSYGCIIKPGFEKKSLCYLAAESRSPNCLRLLLKVTSKTELSSGYGKMHVLSAAIKTGD